jgi:hypothetical protein
VLLKRLGPGDIVLLHDTISTKVRLRTVTSWIDRRAMMEALELVFARIGGRYRFVTVPDWLNADLPAIRTGSNRRLRGLGTVETVLQKLRMTARSGHHESAAQQRTMS